MINMNHCVTTCKYSRFDEVSNKNIGIVVESNISYPTLRINNDFIDNDAELLGKLESIEKEMLNGEGIPFKDVNDLAKRYGL